MDLNFIIPLNQEDLLHTSGYCQYVVNEILTIEELPVKIEECHLKLKHEGAEFLLQQFDVFYSVISQFHNVDQETRKDTWKILKACLSSLYSELELLLSDMNELDLETKNVKLNVLKMSCYLICQFMILFEVESSKASDAIVVTGKGRKKVAPKKKCDDWSWVAECEEIVSILAKICNLPIQVLWDPPVLEEEFINLITNCLYKLLENSLIARSGATQHIFHILGIMIKKHNHALGCCIKIVQLLQQYEHLVPLLAQAVSQFAIEFGSTVLVTQILREIDQMSDHEFSRDTAGTRNLGLFLVELAKLIPSVMQSNISIILSHLESESYTLRNSVLTVIAEIILKLLSGSDLEEKYRNLRDQLLDSLEDHLHDINAFVRCRSLQLWQVLVQEQAVPLLRQRDVLHLSTERLFDKSTTVRKTAIQLITSFLQSNPFAAKLPLNELKENYEKEKEKLNEMAARFDKSEANVENENAEAQQTDTDNSKPKKSDSLVNQEVLVKYLEDSVEFATLIYKAIPIICQLLGSSQVSDVLEAIEFFVVATEFGVKIAVMGVRKMLLLIWSKETNIKEAVVNAYIKLYMKSSTNCERTNSLIMVENLISLALGASMEELMSLENLVESFMKMGHLSMSLIQVLWEQFTMKLPNSTLEKSRIAILLLSMAAGAEIDIIKSNVEVLIDHGFGPMAFQDLRLAKDTCQALLKFASFKKPSSASLDEVYRLPEDHIIFTSLTDILLKGLLIETDFYWVPLSEKAIELIYKLAEHPDKICGKLFINAVKVILKSQNPDIDMTDQEIESYMKIREISCCKTYLLTRLIQMVGHIAFNQLLHVDVSIFVELKRRQNIKEESQNKSKKQKTSKKRLSLSASQAVTPKQCEGDSVDDEMGLIGAVADDAEAEFLKRICDEETVTGFNLLAVVVPLLIEINSNPVKYPDSALRAAACQAFVKFMIVSNEFCEENLQLLFTILERSPEPLIRSIAVTSLNDLGFRFPNLIDPWTSHIYKRLSDESDQVRKNTLTVLMCLILNDMIKVKGQISDVALRIMDSNEYISGMAKMFFRELSKKENAIYNILPDIISRLSNVQEDIKEENFKVIMKFLFSFIQKEKHLENLVEKLCHRFRATSSEHQWEDLAFCLNLISYNEKQLRKLQENFTCYSDKLSNQNVYDCILTIINGAKKSTKQEVKILAEEIEQKIEVCLNKGVGAEDAANSSICQTPMQNRVKATPATGSRRKNGFIKPVQTAKKSVRRRTVKHDDSFESVKTRKTKARKPTLNFDSDSDPSGIFSRSTMD